ncbi:MAG: hypothetical protein LBL73_07495 [Synergistaceae bacterium]|nr:hypothetical protein [Synergistaceae bacterium]
MKKSGRRKKHKDDRVSKLVDSLEIVTSRMLEMTVANNQIATSQTPELRQLFDSWVKCISDELLRMAKEDATLDIGKISHDVGISPSSVISLLASLERRGALAVTHVTTAEGDGRNKDICDCLG